MTAIIVVGNPDNGRLLWRGDDMDRVMPSLDQMAQVRRSFARRIELMPYAPHEYHLGGGAKERGLAFFL